MTKLFNFLDYPQLNNARKFCNAKLLSTSSLLKPYGILPKEGEELLKHGKNIFRHLLEVKNDLLYYKNILVSVNLPRVRTGSPRLHVAYCKKMQELQQNRHNSFFISRALNTRRKIYVETTQYHQTYDIPICKYCLDLIKWKNYSYEMNKQDKDQIVKQFDLKQFYKLYDHPQVHQIFLAMSKENDGH